ncbi:hypothetical protein AVEN_169031-1 [Araneus ventricosus]|uniref:Uncharacterized protein n=1 Tax=Araneus ventricosus TaxID=182803 RepID=A0A4Y2H1V5_ARAVE|nr:hypothetical protein AVEN_169031-1 [Araneus ventricosus]
MQRFRGTQNSNTDSRWESIHQNILWCRKTDFPRNLLSNADFTNVATLRNQTGVGSQVEELAWSCGKRIRKSKYILLCSGVEQRRNFRMGNVQLGQDQRRQ